VSCTAHAYGRRQGPCQSATGACEPPGRATPSPSSRHANPCSTTRDPRQRQPAAPALGPSSTATATFRRAPTGDTPVLNHRPNAISSFRASATLSIFQNRPRPRPNHTRSHGVSGLAGRPPAPRHRNRHGPHLVTASLCAPKLPAGLATLLERQHESGGCPARLGGRSVVPGTACYADSSRALDAKPAQHCERANFRHRPTTGQQTCANRRSSAPRSSGV
jgi:hypothetical protein